MFKKLIFSILLINAVLTSSLVQAEVSNKFRHPFYLGVTEGRGWTTWNGLVPPVNQANNAISISTPVSVNEGGNLWGLFAGYELIPYLALEAAYMHYPDANVVFDALSLFSFNNGGLTSFNTHTETLSLMVKIMMIVPCTDFRAYSSVGWAEVHRYDILKNNWQPSPTFGAGFNYNFNERVMIELGANYTAGRGQSQLNPVENYFPFIYSVFLRLAYRI